MINKYLEVNFLTSGEKFETFWNEYLKYKNRKILYIMGLSFDPRTLHCLKIIHKHIEKNIIDFKILKFIDLIETQRTTKLLNTNTTLLKEIINEEKWNTHEISMNMNVENDLSVNASHCLCEKEIMQYTDIILDINALPNAVYFPILKNMLNWISVSKKLSDTKPAVNVHLVVSENFNLDKKIKESNLNDGITYMHKFGASIQEEHLKSSTKIWIPLLGENQRNQLEKISQEIRPTETCPLFPMPSIDPYRSKNLLLEYSELLYDKFVIDPINYIYTNESNPFETCRSIYETVKSYNNTLKPLGGCKTIISPLSNKLQSIGSLLAAYKLIEDGLKIGIVYVKNQSYDIDSDIDINEINNKSIPYSIWLAGECYDE